MCIILAKYLPDLGWVGVKNRDRGYIPTIKIRKSQKNAVERLYIWDDHTGYTEGLNEHGIAIISASMATVSDEKGQTSTHHEGTRSGYMSPDGKKIRTALLEKTVQSTIAKLVELELTGHTLVFTPAACYLVESGYRHGQFVHKIEKIPHDKTCVRTNHGILLPWAGYQRISDDPSHSRKRVSSEIRKIKAEIGLMKSQTFEEMLGCILDHSDPNPQVNPCRIDGRHGYMNTTGQLALVPSRRTLYYTPIKSAIQFDYDKLNSMEDKCFFEILSQRQFHQNGAN